MFWYVRCRLQVIHDPNHIFQYFQIPFPNGNFFSGCFLHQKHTLHKYIIFQKHTVVLNVLWMQMAFNGCARLIFPSFELETFVLIYARFVFSVSIRKVLFLVIVKIKTRRIEIVRCLWPQTKTWNNVNVTNENYRNYSYSGSISVIFFFSPLTRPHSVIWDFLFFFIFLFLTEKLIERLTFICLVHFYLSFAFMFAHKIMNGKCRYNADSTYKNPRNFDFYLHLPSKIQQAAVNGTEKCK